PVDAEAEDVIGKPDVVGRDVALDTGHLRGDLGRGALQIVIAPDGLRAPGTAEGAPARGCHVEAEPAVRAPPDLAVALDIDEIPGGRWQIPACRWYAHPGR